MVNESPPAAAASVPEPRSEPLPPARPASRSGATLTTAEIVARCEPSVALIKGNVSSGTGFVIKRGIVATNAHVIEEELLSGLEVRFPGAPEGKQGPLSAQLLYEDRKRDVAFLAVTTDLPPLELETSYAFQKGEDITVIGNPGMGDDQVLENAISRGVMSAKTVIEGMNYYQMSIAINHGNSGGPVFDSTGRVIGVATLKSHKAEAMGFCIPVEELRVAAQEINKPHPEMVARHRAVAAFKSLTLAGVLYLVGIVVRSGSVADANAEAVQKLQETVKNLDEKLFSQPTPRSRGCKRNHRFHRACGATTRSWSANYKAMKQIYSSGAMQINQYAGHVDDLRKQHLNLVTAIKDELRVDVDDKLLTVLREPVATSGPPVVVTEMVPFQMQPGLRRGMGPMGPRRVGPQGPMGPGQQMQRQMQQMQRQMQQQQRQMQRQLQQQLRGMQP